MIQNKKRYIIATVLLLTVVMNLVDGIVRPTYAIKSFIKVLLFCMIPLVFFLAGGTESAQLKKMFIPRKKGILPALALSTLCFGGIVGGYFLLRGSVDFSGITRTLTGDSGITVENFLYVALYISFCNSFLEEFFFRGYAFLALKDRAKRGMAYAFSALCFALYHIGMTTGWLALPIFLLELAGLSVGGLFFDYLNEKTETIYPSWIVHMFCNFGINTIGLFLFGIL